MTDQTEEQPKGKEFSLADLERAGMADVPLSKMRRADIEEGLKKADERENQTKENPHG